MNPNNQSQGGGFAGNPPQGQPQPSPSPQQVHSQPLQPAAPQVQPQQGVQQHAAANVLRTQIDSLYGDSPVATPHDATPQPVPETGFSATQAASPQAQAAPQSQEQQQSAAHNPYARTHTETTAQHANIDPKQWKEYHSAWQDYYQKYYEAYYEHQKKQAQPTAFTGAIGSGPAPVEAAAPAVQATVPNTPQELSKAEALQELRNKLLNNVKERAVKVRKSRHFIPIAAAVVVMLIFVFLQYNRVLIGTVNAYVSPGSIDPQNIIVNPGGDGVISDEPRLIIPKINVDVPVLYDVGADHNSQMDAMEKGVAHFSIPGASSHPGEKGNTVLSGHSSNDLFDRGDYKFIFAQLDKLNDGDTIYANYQGKRYTYVVTKKEVVKPTEVSKLVYPTEKPVMTLITCTPLGTSLNRLLVTAEQISPNPNEATAAPSDSSVSGSDAAMPGNSATLLERMFGGR